MKTCNVCGETKPLDEFPNRYTAAGTRRAECRVCHAAKRRAMYDSRMAIVPAAKDVPCSDCGQRFPSECMDFDHLPGTTKLFRLNEVARRLINPELIVAEIAKCEVVCANCHRIRTAHRTRGCDGGCGHAGCGGRR